MSKVHPSGHLITDQTPSRTYRQAIFQSFYKFWSPHYRTNFSIKSNWGLAKHSLSRILYQKNLHHIWHQIFSRQLSLRVTWCILGIHKAVDWCNWNLFLKLIFELNKYSIWIHLLKFFIFLRKKAKRQWYVLKIWNRIRNNDSLFFSWWRSELWRSYKVIQPCKAVLNDFDLKHR